MHEIGFRHDFCPGTVVLARKIWRNCSLLAYFLTFVIFYWILLAFSLLSPIFSFNSHNLLLFFNFSKISPFYSLIFLSCSLIYSLVLLLCFLVFSIFEMVRLSRCLFLTKKHERPFKSTLFNTNSSPQSDSPQKIPNLTEKLHVMSFEIQTLFTISYPKENSFFPFPS